ncbi:MAGE homology domain [Dillenia turbinata]|uniref:MAGE homology domain n=1 Tax=Dillenia turbinata TaxID=194707 RepID=A0AAN8VQH8_9MAGN
MHCSFVAAIIVFGSNDLLFRAQLFLREKDKLVAEVVRYVLFKNQQTSGCPITREDLTHLITVNYSQRGLPAYVVNEAQEKLSSIFGYELRELQKPRQSSRNSARSSQQSTVESKSYVIVSQLPADIFKKYVDDENTAHLIGFTYAVIGTAYLAGGRIAEEALWHHLRRMGVSEENDDHPVLGNLKHALEALVNQRKKTSGPEGNILFYELGERAIDETVGAKIKGHISQVKGNVQSNE